MKKKNLFLASFMLMLLSLFFACQKNDDVSVAEKGNEHNEPASDAGPGDADGAIGTRSISELDYADCPQLLGAVTKSAGRLVFQDEEHFEKCALCLDYQYGVHNDAFDAQYPNATAEELDGYAALTAFNEWQPYINFESNLNFSSYRAKIQTESDAFLASTPSATIDLSLDPDGLCPIVRTSDRTLLNNDGEAMVGGLLKTEEDWTERGLGDDCASLRRNQEFFTVDPLREVRLRIWVQSGNVASKLWGNIKYYKRDSPTGNFRSDVRADMRVRVIGRTFDHECRTELEDWSNRDGWKHRTNLQVTSVIWGKWRQAFADDDDPRWQTDASFVIAELFRNPPQYIFLRGLRKN